MEEEWRRPTAFRCIVVLFKSCDAADFAGSAWGTDAILHGASCNHSTKSEKTTYVDKYSQFEKFSKSGLCRLGLQHLQDMDLAGIWKETESFAVS